MKRLRMRQRDRIGPRRIMRAVAAVGDTDRDRLKEIAHSDRQLADRGRVGRLGVVMPRKPVDLRRVEHVVPLHEPDRFLGGLTSQAIGVGLARRAVEHAERAALALADMGAEFERLAEGHPVGAGVAPALSHRP